MPRNGSGTSSVINTFVIDTIADPDEVNANFTDVADQLTNSLPRDGQAGMNAPLPLQNGTAALPALTFSSDTNTGVYRKAADTVAIAGNGVDIAIFGPTGVELVGSPTGTFLQGYLYGLTLSNNVSDATNDIDIAVGSAASDTSTYHLMPLASGLTKRLDSGWAVGTGNGGLDTGSIANTTYHVFLIQRSDTGVVDALFSASATSPTMPTNYDRKRRIGSIIRSGATILAFRQFGDRFMLSMTVTARSSTSAFADAVLAVTAPAGIRTRPILTNILSVNAASSVQNSFGDGDASATQFVGQTVTNGVADTAKIDEVYTNTSSQIRYSCQINSGTIVQNVLNSAGWWDDRGTTGP
jgi:hypothetical protein